MSALRRLTRRELAAGLAAATPGASQTPSRPDSANHSQLLQQARASGERNREALKRFKLEMKIEPATVYRP